MENKKYLHCTIKRVIVFDDYVDGYDRWAPICKRCIRKYGIDDRYSGDAYEEKCGVHGCNNQADYFFDIDDAVVKPTSERF